MERVAALAKHFNIPAAACINKYDLNAEMSGKIQTYCEKVDIRLLGMIPYDTVVTRALVEKKIIVEYGNGNVSGEIEKIWVALTQMLGISDQEG
jgi:MinD superfamily P-loop ATPase